MLEKVWSKRNLSYMIGGKVNWCSSYGKWYGSASKRLKVELPYDLETPLLGTYPDKTIIWNNTRTSLFTAALFTTARTWKQLKCPATDEWIKKMWYLCPMGYYSFIKKKRIMLCAAAWMNLGVIILSEGIQKGKTNIVWYHLHVGSKIQQKLTHPRNRNRLTDREQTCGC